VNQTRNLTRHIKELESIYGSLINEANDTNVYVDAAKDALGHSPEATKIQPNTGPDNVDDIDKPIKQESDSLKLRHKDINTSMNDKNVFDRLYSTIMEDGEEFDMNELEAGLEGGEEPSMDDEIGGEEITLTITSDQAEALRGLLSQLEEPASDDIEDLEGDDFGGMDDMGGEEENFMSREAVDAEHTGQGQQPGHDPTQLGPKKKNVVPGNASKTSSGIGNGTVTDKVGNDGHLRDTTAQMTANTGRSNVVGGRASKGSNQDLFQ